MVCWVVDILAEDARLFSSHAHNCDYLRGRELRCCSGALLTSIINMDGYTALWTT